MVMAVLQIMIMSVDTSVIITLLLLLLSGDIEENPGPKDFDYNTVDATQVLDEDDLIDVLEEIISVKLAYFSLGQSLRLKTNDLRRIRQEYPNDSDANLALSEVLVLWLQRKYNVGRFGPPTWRMLVEAVHRKVGADDDDLAKQIALKHPAAHQKSVDASPGISGPCDNDLNDSNECSGDQNILYKEKIPSKDPPTMANEVNLDHKGRKDPSTMANKVKLDQEGRKDPPTMANEVKLYQEERKNPPIMANEVNLDQEECKDPPTMANEINLDQEERKDPPTMANEINLDQEGQCLGPCNMREVLDFFWDYRSKWKIIGIELGIDTGTLDCIDKDNRWTEEALVAVINYWLRNNPKPTTKAMLMVLQSKYITAVTEVPVQGHEINLANYAKYLKSLYRVKTLASISDDQWPPPVTHKIFRLAILKAEEQVRRGKLDEGLIREKTIGGRLNYIMNCGKVIIELKDIFNSY